MDDDVTSLVPLVAARALPERSLRRAVRWTGGLTNRTFRLSFADGHDAALRLYTQSTAVAAKEVDVHRVLAGRVPVPKLLAADIRGDAGIPPYAIFQWIEGPLFRTVRAQRDPAATAAAAAGIGAALARLADFRPAGLRAATSSADEILSAVVNACESGRLDGELAERIRRHVERRRARLDELDADPVLVHGDFSSRNIVLDTGDPAWSVAGIIDWERARLGCPLIDIGSILRYETGDRAHMEPYFSTAYREHGGTLPDDWRSCARTYDLIDLVRALNDRALPGDAREEILAHITATVTG